MSQINSFSLKLFSTISVLDMANAGLFPMGTTVKICRKIDDKTGVPFHMADIVPKCHSGMLLDNAYVVIWELG
jgi:hypothetical protein